MNKDTIAVIGAGLMGHSIAYVMAAGGHPVSIYDPNVDTLRKVPEQVTGICEIFGEPRDCVSSIALHQELDQAIEGASLVIEAAPEKLAIKQEIFQTLDALTAPEVMLASNTSAIPITEIASQASRRDRIFGMHFWNPPHFVPLVEVVQTDDTDPSHIDAAMELLDDVGMSPVHVRKDIPGFIGNRLQHALKREAIALVADGVCDAATLDRVVKEGFGSRLGVLGPLEQSDMIGLQLTLDCHETLIQHLDRTPHDHPILRQKLAAGETGMASGQGFRSWTAEEAESVRTRFRDHMARQARARRNALKSNSKGGADTAPPTLVEEER